MTIRNEIANKQHKLLKLKTMNNEEYEQLKNQTQSISDEMFQLMVELFPICTSITGNGVRKTLKIISNYIPLKIHEVKSGTKVFDWTIPEEWNIKDAYILDSKKKKILNFQKSNLHVLQYSIPIKKNIKLSKLKKHIFTLPNQSDIIPYVTSYYSKNWGFCMTHNEFLKLKDSKYFVCINSSHTNGSLTYGEYVIKGKVEEEILISTYICHPSLCNDNLSGVVLTALLAKYLSKYQLHYSLRFLFIPETIGAITWLALNEKKIKNIAHGLVATCLGDPGISTYKKSRNGNNIIDEIVEQVLIESGEPYKIMDFWPSGSDERQYCSPAFNLPIGSLMRTPYDMYDEYHTSADNLDFVSKHHLANTLSKYLAVINKLEENHGQFKQKKLIIKNKKSSKDDPVFLNLYPKCEPQLGKRGAYENIGGVKEQNSLKRKKAVQWILNFSDGKYSLSDIQKKSNLDFSLLLSVANFLKNKKLLSEI